MRVRSGSAFKIITAQLTCQKLIRRPRGRKVAASIHPAAQHCLPFRCGASGELSALMTRLTVNTLRGVQQLADRQRRDLVVLTALPQIAPKSYAMKRAHGELFELGEQLARAQPELARILRWVDEVWEMYVAEVRRRGTWPEDAAEWTWRDAPRLIVPPENVSNGKPKLAQLMSGQWTPSTHAIPGLIRYAAGYCRLRRARPKIAPSRR